MSLIKCSKCGDEKPDSHFYDKSLWKRMSDGTVKRYPKRKVKQCNSCIYKRDKVKKRERMILKYRNKEVWNLSVEG
jgi:hypothetical protein